MHIDPLHSWDLRRDEAAALQKKLATQVNVRVPLTHCETVAGADVSYNRRSTTFYAAVVVLRRSDWTVIETQSAVGENAFPYIPGLLSFREAPILLEAFAKVQTPLGAVMCDGQGIAHQRRLGIASHLGLWLNVPTIGCGKSRLVGSFTEPGPNPGDQSPLQIGDEVIGAVLRTKARTKPMFVSPGHLIDLPSAVALVLEACHGYRQPEPTRQAHLKVNEIRRAANG